MRSPLSPILCAAAICAAILAAPPAGVAVLIIAAFGAELLAVPRPQ